MSLAAKLPYDHPYAGGFPGLSSQSLPTDSDCLTYLAAVAAADGAGVETGVAMAVDTFIKALKADSLWESIGSSCLLCGPRTLAGALVPLRGDAPTANGFVEGDYSRDTGLQGDGTSYLDSNRANDADPQNDKHIAVYKTANATQNGGLIGTVATSEGASWLFDAAAASGDSIRVNEEPSIGGFDFGANTFVGASRSSPSSCDYRVNGTSGSAATDSGPPAVDSIYVFRAALSQVTNAGLAFYSIGSSLDLAKMDSHISSYVTAIGAAL